jgi:hypothetical protein
MFVWPGENLKAMCLCWNSKTYGWYFKVLTTDYQWEERYFILSNRILQGSVKADFTKAFPEFDGWLTSTERR